MAITVNPARAGMIPKAFTAGPSAASKPRASGDDPAITILEARGGR